MSHKDWSNKVAEIVADSLLSVDLIHETDLDKAIEVIAEEIYCRLCLEDTP
jgi:hypothetical protein